MLRGFCLPCGARLSSGRGYCRAWALEGKRRCKWHGGKSTGPRTGPGLAKTLDAMARGRERKAAFRRIWGWKAPGGRPGQISDRLRAAIIEMTKRDLAKTDVGRGPRANVLGDSGDQEQQLADLEQDGLALLIEELRLPIGTKNRNRAAIRHAFYLVTVERERVRRDHRQRSQLDELIETLALS